MYPNRTVWKSLPLKRSTTIWRTMATIRMTTRKRNPFHVSAARAMKMPAITALTRTAFLETSSASAALTVFTTNQDMNATRNAARPYSVPLEKTVVLMGSARKAKTRAATTPTLLSNISLATRYTGMHVRAPMIGLRAPIAADAASVVDMPMPVSTVAMPAPMKSKRGGKTLGPPLG